MSFFDPFLWPGDNVDLELCRKLQEGGFDHQNDKILAWLLRNRVYNPMWNFANTILQCHNKLGLMLLLEEGDDPNHRDANGVHALNSSDQTAEMVDALIAAGARLELLSRNHLPSWYAMRRLLQLSPDTVNPSSLRSGLLIGSSRSLFAPCLGWVFCASLTISSLLLDKAWRRTFYAALFSYRFVDYIPDEARKSWHLFLWRRHTHHLFDDYTKEGIMMALLCLQRLCRGLPQEMRVALLVLSFGEAYLIGAELRDVGKMRNKIV